MLGLKYKFISYVIKFLKGSGKLPCGGTELLETSTGVGIGGLRMGFLSYVGGGGMGLLVFGMESIEFKMFSSDRDREKTEDDVDETVVVGAM